MESTVSLKILFVFFFFLNLIGRCCFFLMLMTSIKSFCLLQNKKETNTHTHTQTNHNVNTCHYLKMIILIFFLLSNFFFRENIKKNYIYFFTGENANNNLMF